MPSTIRSAYLHLPFCRSICPYCDFYVLVEKSGQREALLARLRDEIRTETAEAPPLETVYFGGGTPSQLRPEEIGGLLAALRERYGLAAGAEVTLETNPEGLDAGRLADFRRAGVSRVSLGVQSFDDAALRQLGRRHRGAEALRAIELVREAGFATFSVDLIYGVPGLDLRRSLDSVQRVIDLEVPHVSHYGLTWHEETWFGRRQAAGRLSPVDEDLEADVYEAAVGLLEAAGREHYEISNFAKPGHRSRHNLLCWEGWEYLAFGPSAVGIAGGRRYRNATPLAAWLQGAAREPEPVEGRTAEVESVIAGLRLVHDGLAREAFRRRHGRDVAEAFPEALARGRETGLLELDAERLRLAGLRATLLYDSVIGWFLEDASDGKRGEERERT